MMFENLCYAVVFLAEAMTAKLYFDLLFEKKKKNSFIHLCFLIGYFILFSIFDSTVFIVNAASFVIVNVVIILLSYKCGIFTAILHTLYMTFIMSCTEYLVVLFLTAIFKDYAAYTYNFVAMVSFSILSKIIYFLVIVITAKVIKPNKKEEKI